MFSMTMTVESMMIPKSTAPSDSRFAGVSGQIEQDEGAAASPAEY